MKSISGVYCILNLKNKKRYIGSSKDISYRKIHHFSELRKDRHANKILQASFNKHGEKCFTFLPIELEVSLSSLIEREQFWIDFYKTSNRKFGYNILPFAGTTLGNCGWHHSKETKEKIRNSILGQKRTLEQRNNMSISQLILHASGYSNPSKGKKRSKNIVLKAVATRKRNGSYFTKPETKLKMSEAQLKRWKLIKQH